MKKYRQRYQANTEDDNNSLSYPLYPSSPDLSDKENNNPEESLHWIPEAIYPVSKISRWHENEYNGD
ncbi:MAG TPA: hypothetical protein VKT28_15900 [Puia sp.]|nr:hypothetical protein [Puia sp.]